ncbi:hypothetical protein TRVA0_035S00760 [Trichomonascus vanleenenianus]|uniref:uncharacterized protein n=1 Tax=Trichomonascus vanleenenianus TaxID=2268995 RepID=UPI003ECA2452
MQFKPVFYVLLATALAAATAPGAALEARQFALLDGARNSVQNARQHVDSVVNNYRKNPDRAGAAAVTSVLTGLDSQIDTAIATVSNALAPFTFGVSKAIGGALLGPFAQSVTDGLEVVIGNVVGGAFDLATSPITGSLQRNIARLIQQSQEYGMNVSRLQTLQAQLQNSLPKSKSAKGKRDVQIETRQFALLDGARNSAQNAQQHVDAVFNNYRQNPDRAGAAAVTAVLTGLDSQIDTTIATVSNALAPFTFGVSKAVGNALLGPFAQSVTDGLEVVIGNTVGGAFDLATSPLTGSLQRSISRLIQQSQEYGVNVSRLQTLQAQLQNSLPRDTKGKAKGKDKGSHSRRDINIEARQFALLDGARNSVQKAQQHVDSVTNNYRHNPDRAGAAAVTAVLTGLDSQIDTAIATVSNALAPFTLGVSQAVGNACWVPLRSL